MKAFIKCAPGRLIRMHDRGFVEVPAEGTEVVLDTTYQKALAVGDIVIVDPEEPVTPTETVAAQDPVQDLPADQPMDDPSTKTKKDRNV